MTPEQLFIVLIWIASHVGVAIGYPLKDEPDNGDAIMLLILNGAVAGFFLFAYIDAG